MLVRLNYGLEIVKMALLRKSVEYFVNHFFNNNKTGSIRNDNIKNTFKLVLKYRNILFQYMRKIIQNFLYLSIIVIVFIFI